MTIEYGSHEQRSRCVVKHIGHLPAADAPASHKSDCNIHANHQEATNDGNRHFCKAISCADLVRNLPCSHQDSAVEQAFVDLQTGMQQAWKNSIVEPEFGPSNLLAWRLSSVDAFFATRRTTAILAARLFSFSAQLGNAQLMALEIFASTPQTIPRITFSN